MQSLHILSPIGMIITTESFFIYFQGVAASNEIGGMRRWSLQDHRLSSRRHFIGSGCLTRPQKGREEADF